MGSIFVGLSKLSSYNSDWKLLTHMKRTEKKKKNERIQFAKVSMCFPSVAGSSRDLLVMPQRAVGEAGQG